MKKNNYSFTKSEMAEEFVALLSFPEVPYSSPSQTTKYLQVGNRGLSLIMEAFSIEERLDIFFDWLNEYDNRTLPFMDNWTQFSHRLHWDENPFAEAIQSIDKDEAFYLGFVYSLCNEDWKVFSLARENKLNDLPMKGYSRSDLYQVWMPKGSNKRDFIIDKAREVCDKYKHLDNDNTIMGNAHNFSEYLRKEWDFPRALYLSKNLFRNISMGKPEWISPDSFVMPGTGSYLGFQQIFGGEYLKVMKKGMKEELLKQFDVLINDDRNPIKRHQYINIEDKVCFFYKWLAMQVGFKKKMKPVPMERIFPSNPQNSTYEKYKNK